MFLFAFQGTMLACPNCKEAYTEAGVSLSSGYSPSILFLMITPFVVMGIVGLRIYFSVKKKRKLDAES
jgi:hypothetical protein